jgi:hypothetical protein
MARRLAEIYKGCIDRRISWSPKLYEFSVRFLQHLTMSEQSSTLSVDPNSSFTPDTRLFTDSNILYPESSRDSVGLDVTFRPVIDDFSSGWGGEQVLGQQQHYQPDQSHQQQSQRQHTQPQQGQDWTLSQVPDRQVSCTLTAPSLASTAGVLGIRPTSPYDADWYFPQAPHHIPFASMVDSEGRCIAGLPDLEQSPAVEIPSTSRERSGFETTEQ